MASFVEMAGSISGGASAQNWSCHACILMRVSAAFASRVQRSPDAWPHQGSTTKRGARFANKQQAQKSARRRLYKLRENVQVTSCIKGGRSKKRAKCTHLGGIGGKDRKSQQGVRDRKRERGFISRSRWVSFILLIDKQESEFPHHPGACVAVCMHILTRMNERSSRHGQANDEPWPGRHCVPGLRQKVLQSAQRQ